MTVIRTLVPALALAALLASSPSHAQDGSWEVSISPYLFMAETETSLDTAVGPVDSTLSFGDALENLDFAFMGGVEVSNGRWSFIADYLYFDLSFGNDTPGPLFSGLDSALETQILNGYVAYRAYTDPAMSVDVAAGFRWFDTDSEFELRPGAAAGRTFAAQDDWVDPVVGIRLLYRFSDRWVGSAFLDYGGFSGDRDTWQVFLTGGYEISDSWIIRGGYRYIEVNNDEDGQDFSFSQSGPVIGVTYRF